MSFIRQSIHLSVSYLNYPRQNHDAFTDPELCLVYATRNSSKNSKELKLTEGANGRGRDKQRLLVNDATHNWGCCKSLIGRKTVNKDQTWQQFCVVVNGPIAPLQQPSRRAIRYCWYGGRQAWETAGGRLTCDQWMKCSDDRPTQPMSDHCDDTLQPCVQRQGCRPQRTDCYLTAAYHDHSLSIHTHALVYLSHSAHSITDKSPDYSQCNIAQYNTVVN